MSREDPLTCPDCGVTMAFSQPITTGPRNEWGPLGGKVTDFEWECPDCLRIGDTVAEAEEAGR